MLRRILNAHSKTPIECLYLELGIIPFRFQLMKRRIMYYQLIMKRDDNEITKAVVMRQKQTKLKGDFFIQVSHDLEALKLSENDIRDSSEEGLKQKLEKQLHDAAYVFLMDAASKHSKVHSEIYKDLEGMKYLDDERFTPDLANLLFKFRTRMFNVKNNFRNQYKANLLCPLCRESDDSQEHLLECRVILRKLNGEQYCYRDIFSENLVSLLDITKGLKKVVKIREEMEKKSTDQQL